MMDYLTWLEKHGGFTLEFNAGRREQQMVDNALKKWEGSPGHPHEVVFREECSGHYEYSARTVPDTESGYQDASPGPHASIVAERGKAKVRQ